MFGGLRKKDEDRTGKLLRSMDRKDRLEQRLPIDAQRKLVQRRDEKVLKAMEKRERKDRRDK